MKINTVTLNKEEVEELIDKECRKRLGISREEFLRKRIPHSVIEMLLKLIRG